jgi:TRAP-type transport system small permease protein
MVDLTWIDVIQLIDNKGVCFMKSIIAFAIKSDDILSKTVEIIVIFLTAVLCILTTTGVVTRYIFNFPLVWLYEVTVLTFVWTMFLAVSIAFKRGDHIFLEFLVHGVSKKMRKYVRIFISLVIVFFLLNVIYYGIQIVSTTIDQSYQTIPVSTAWFYGSFPVGAVISIIHFVRIILGLIFNKEEEKEVEGRVMV